MPAPPARKSTPTAVPAPTLVPPPTPTPSLEPSPEPKPKPTLTPEPAPTSQLTVDSGCGVLDLATRKRLASGDIKIPAYVPARASVPMPKPKPKSAPASSVPAFAPTHTHFPSHGIAKRWEFGLSNGLWRVRRAYRICEQKNML